MPLAAFLLSLVKPLVGRVLLALGISLVTVTGFNLTIQTVRNQLLSNLNSMGADIMNLFLLSGLGEGLGIVFGAITTKLVIMQANSALKFIGINQG